MSRNEQVLDTEEMESSTPVEETVTIRRDISAESGHDDDEVLGLPPGIQNALDALLCSPVPRSAVAKALGFRYDADMLPVAIVVAVVVADTWVMLTQSFLVNVAWFVLMLVPKAVISAWNHHHAHVPTFESIYLNYLLELLYLTITGVGPGLWYLHHVIGHHRHYLDQTLDESGWRTTGGRTMGSIEYGLEVWGTAYWRAISVSRQHSRLFRGLLWLPPAALVFCALVYARGLPVLVTLGLAPTVSLYITAWHTYYQHAGLPDTKSHFEASFNIEDPLYNVLTLNLGYHTAHHYRGSIHWSRLPAAHAILRSLIPPNLFRRPPVPLRYFSQPLRTEEQKPITPAIRRVYQFPADSSPHRWQHLNDVVTVPLSLRRIPDQEAEKTR